MNITAISFGIYMLPKILRHLEKVFVNNKSLFTLFLTQINKLSLISNRENLNTNQFLPLCDNYVPP